MREQVHEFCRVGHLCVDLQVFGGNEKAGKRVDHEAVDFIHTVLEVKWPQRLVHEAVMQHNGLEDCPCLQLKLLTTFDEPLNEHFAHLVVLRVDGHGNHIHALSVDRAQDFCHRKNALETHVFVAEYAHASLNKTQLRLCLLRMHREILSTYLGEEDAALATVSHALVAKQARVRTFIRLKPSCLLPDFSLGHCRRLISLTFGRLRRLLLRLRGGDITTAGRLEYLRVVHSRLSCLLGEL